MRAKGAILAGLPPKALTPDEAGAIARTLQAKGTPTVSVKLGEQGCLLADGAKQLLVPSPKVKAVDTTAAGDVFNAALAVALSEGKDLEAACGFAVKAGAVSVTRMGAQSRALPTATKCCLFSFGDVDAAFQLAAGPPAGARIARIRWKGRTWFAANARIRHVLIKRQERNVILLRKIPNVSLSDQSARTLTLESFLPVGNGNVSKTRAKFARVGDCTRRSPVNHTS